MFAIGPSFGDFVAGDFDDDGRCDLALALDSFFAPGITVALNQVQGDCPGDYDCSGTIDFFDIDLLLAALGGEDAWFDEYETKFGTPPPCYYLANCDANGDGVVDFFDIDAFLELLGQTCPE